MDEQRKQEYIKLIDNLLLCSSGKEFEVLRAHQELVDADFIEAIAQVANSYRQKGEVEKASWLYQVADDIESTLRTSIKGRDSFRESYNFLIKSFQETSQQALQNDNASTFNLTRQFLLSNREQLNPDLLKVFPKAVSDFTELATSSEEKYALSVILNLFGMAIQGIPIGERQDNIEMAIIAYEQSLELTRKEVMSGGWVSAMNNLASAYFARPRGDRATNIEQAIQTHNEVLTVATKDAMPEIWAATMSNLANSYNFRMIGPRSENIERAIKACQQALIIRKKPEGVTQRLQGTYDGFHSFLALQIIFNFIPIEFH